MEKKNIKPSKPVIKTALKATGKTKPAPKVTSNGTPKKQEVKVVVKTGKDVENKVATPNKKLTLIKKPTPIPLMGVKGVYRPEPKKPEVAIDPNAPKPKGLYSLEFQVNSSPDVLFEFISTPGGLENWFADRVYIIEGNFVFNWEDGEKRLAKQIEIRDHELVRYHWLDEPDKRYFEFKIQIDDLTSEVALIVSDFADSKEEMEESGRLWESQVHDLHHAIGSSS